MATTATGNVNLGTIDALRRQPDNFDYASASQFKATLSNFPLSEYFCTALTLPGLTLGVAPRTTSLATIPMVGDTLAFDDFSMTFLVEEQLTNYREIFNWMINIGFPKSHAQYKAQARADDTNRGGELVLYSDIQITILSNKNNPIVRTTIYEAFPTNLSGLEYSAQSADTDWLTATVTFAYAYYEFAEV